MIGTNYGKLATILKDNLEGGGLQNSSVYIRIMVIIGGICCEYKVEETVTKDLTMAGTIT